MKNKLIEVTVRTIVGERFKDFESIKNRLNETLLFSELELKVEFIEHSIIEGTDFHLMLSVCSDRDEEFFADFDVWYLKDNEDNYYITGADLFKTNKGIRN